MVVVRGQETCQDVLAYLNNFNSVGKYYCDNTMIRGGWSLSDCGDPAMNTNPYATPGNAQTAPPAQQVKPSPRLTEPGTAPAAKDASLMQVSAPLQVRFGADVNSVSQGAGQIVSGILEEDLMSGDTVIAPAGSEVLFRIVPTSYWTDGGGDAFEIQATAVKVGARSTRRVPRSASQRDLWSASRPAPPNSRRRTRRPSSRAPPLGSRRSETRTSRR
jgi:hypothetical protein